MNNKCGLGYDVLRINSIIENVELTKTSMGTNRTKDGLKTERMRNKILLLNKRIVLLEHKLRLANKILLQSNETIALLERLNESLVCSNSLKETANGDFSKSGIFTVIKNNSI